MQNAKCKTVKVAAPLRWKKPTSEDADTSQRKIWLSRCGRYRVVRCESNYGLPTVFYAMRFDWPPKFKRGLWTTISRHRKRSTALRACEADAKLAAPLWIERIKPR